MTRAMADVRSAIGFLTRIPVGRIEAGGRTLGGAAAYFPLVGVIVAGTGGGAWWVGASLLGPFAGAVLAVLATVVVTGAIHEDGLADTVDGFWGGATPERRLEIMRDSRVGTYGVIAVVGDLLLWVAVLAPYGTDDWLDVSRILVAGQVIGRAAPIALATLPPARSDGQGARMAIPGRAGLAIAAGTVTTAAVGAVGWWAPVPIVAGGLAVALLRLAARRRIGGVTGDVHGAGVAVTSLVVAAAVAALLREELGWDA